MRVHYCDHFPVPLPEGHRFPMHKYARLRERLVESGVLEPQQLIAAEPVDLVEVRAVHTPGYVDAFLGGTLSKDAVRRLGFPWSQQLVRRTLASVGGTCMAASAALEDGISGNLAGGTHHAYRDFGSGFCAFNDIAIAAVGLLNAGRIRRALVFDVDVHQGDGTAAIFASDERVFTCSLHGAKNFPARKTVSDLDVPLADDTGDEPYLEAMVAALESSLDAARPDIVFVQAGVDGLATDRLGRLALSSAGMAERDRVLLERCSAGGLPTVLTLGGGYSEPIEHTIEANMATYAAARACMRASQQPRTRVQPPSRRST